jgi:hypothetical protein
MEYKIHSSSSSELVARWVTEDLKNGWKLRGELQVSLMLENTKDHGTNITKLYTQVVIKEA